ncbi:restriction endonuclease subunit S [Leisingera caerulea]|uniref:restriction endonuclease subunit S n=1 Tax=Leisingera caerulea TaxID=506591 RepID=UPI0021A7A220|nr:restriction endonuclease subunit S [Leisingera caerulea]UWQ48962.1 restriction endonuclease subunit S [Leisingera caerulea]
MNIAAYPKHDNYKDSGIDWIGEVPSSWSVEPGRQCLFESKEKNIGMKESTVLSLSYGRVIVKDEDKLTGLVPESFETYQVVQPGDIIIRGTDLQNDMTSLRTGLARDTGIITSAYINLRPKAEIDPKFLHYLLHSYDVKKVFYALGSGLRQNLSCEDFKYLRLPIPGPSEQRAIAAFLDGKSAKIDEAVRIKEEQIRLLAERRQILIQQVVTRGLNPDASMKDSGIDWIGQIPAHWEVKRGKHLFREVNERSEEGTEELLSVSHTTGVTARSEKNVNMFLAEDYSGSKLCQPGDIVINTMWAWMGALGVSDLTGIISPSYGVYRSLDAGAFNRRFLEWLLRTTPFIQQYNKISTGLHSSRLRLYPHMFLGLFMAFPSRKEQDAIVEHVEREAGKIDKAISVKQSQITALREYRTSLINAAVTGKIKVI